METDLWCMDTAGLFGLGVQIEEVRKEPQEYGIGNLGGEKGCTLFDDSNGNCRGEDGVRCPLAKAEDTHHTISLSTIREINAQLGRHTDTEGTSNQGVRYGQRLVMLDPRFQK